MCELALFWGSSRFQPIKSLHLGQVAHLLCSDLKEESGHWSFLTWRGIRTLPEVSKFGLLYICIFLIGLSHILFCSKCIFSSHCFGEKTKGWSFYRFLYSALKQTSQSSLQMHGISSGDVRSLSQLDPIDLECFQLSLFCFFFFSFYLFVFLQDTAAVSNPVHMSF